MPSELKSEASRAPSSRAPRGSPHNPSVSSGAPIVADKELRKEPTALHRSSPDIHLCAPESGNQEDHER
jgi:hypothetical protein